MKIIQIHNSTLHRGGGENMVESISSLLTAKGHHVVQIKRSNEGLTKDLARRVDAFINGIYSIPAEINMIKYIKAHSPEIVHVHGLYPFFTPSILVACRKREIPVILHCHSFQLVCPNSLLFRNSDICELCCDNKEYWCILKNCRKNIFESCGYALRHFVARRFQLVNKNVSLLIALTDFAKQRLVKAGYEKDRIVVMPNMARVQNNEPYVPSRNYVAYVGRLSQEKGIETLMLAAEKLSGIPISVAGDGPLMSTLVERAPRNVRFLGKLAKQELNKFYLNARFVIVPSLCPETFCLVAAEAMGYGLPVVASDIGGLAELVENGKNGFLFEAGNVLDLENKMGALWNSPELCRQMGEAGRKKAILEYNEDTYYKRLIKVYKRAMDSNIHKRRDDESLP